MIFNGMPLSFDDSFITLGFTGIADSMLLCWEKPVLLYFMKHNFKYKTSHLYFAGEVGRAYFSSASAL